MCYDGDAAEFWQEKRVRGNKPHKCCECDSPIPLRHRHVKVTLCQEGDWGTYRMHEECWQLWQDVIKNLCGDVGGVSLGQLSEEFGEYGVAEGDTVESLTEDWDGVLPEDVARALPFGGGRAHGGAVPADAPGSLELGRQGERGRAPSR